MFTRGEAEEYLRAALADQPRLAEEAAELAAELGFLPLALAQAAAYMMDLCLSCAEYRTRWTDRRRSVSSLLPKPDGLPDEHRATVATTWSLSVTQANRLEPAGIAGSLLEVASVLDPNGIPAALFTTSPITGLLARRTGVEVDAERARDGLGCLHRLNLITLDSRSDTPTVRVHALVQRATRDALPPQRLTALAVAVADALLASWPDDLLNPDLAAGYRANTLTLHDHARDALWQDGVHQVLRRVGWSLADTGQHSAAASHGLRLEEIAMARLGRDHLDSVDIRRDLADYAGIVGDAETACDFLGNLYDNTRFIFGPFAECTLRTRRALAHWTGEAGHPVEARDQLAELLIDQEQHVGSEHPDTRRTKEALAHWTGEAGDPDGAREMLNLIVRDMDQSPGEPRSVSVRARHAMLHWTGVSGDIAGARDGYRALFEDAIRHRGQTRLTQAIVEQFVHWTTRTGDLISAQEDLEMILEAQNRCYQQNDLTILEIRATYAQLVGDSGKPAEARDLLISLLPMLARAFGSFGADALQTRIHIAHWTLLAGDRAAARKQLVAVIDDQIAALGLEHPIIKAARAELEATKRFPRARAQLRRSTRPRD